jgi:hypothetical protein
MLLQEGGMRSSPGAKPIKHFLTQIYTLFLKARPLIIVILFFFSGNVLT